MSMLESINWYLGLGTILAELHMAAGSHDEDWPDDFAFPSSWMYPGYLLLWPFSVLGIIAALVIRIIRSRP